MKYKDRRRTRSAVITPIDGEDYRTRHKRRLDLNLSKQDFVAEEAAALGLTLRVTNDGHHWQFRGGDLNADWWPSSAKLVFDSKFKSGVHVHDYQRLIEEIAKEVYRRQPKPKARKRTTF